MRRVAGVMVVSAMVCIAACSSGGSGGKAGGTTTSTATSTTATTSAGAPALTLAGREPEAAWRARQDDYLAYAVKTPLDPGFALSDLAHAESDRRHGRTPDLSAVTPAVFADQFASLERFDDTGDFKINDLLTLLLRERDALPAATVKAIETRILAFKYWWTEPTPKGITDSQYYWTENHQIIYLADEYVAGQAYPDRTFTNSGMTGRQHMAHAVPRIAEWLKLRARFGFSEWLSDVYTMEDVKGLLLLAEDARDPAIAKPAASMLDVLLIEMASHLQRGTFGATHGRSYQKDKLQGPDEDTFASAKLLFDRTPTDYANIDNAVLLAVAARYRPPAVAVKIAQSTDVAIIRQHAGLPLDPLAPVDPAVKAPEGLSFTGEDGLMTWWGMGAQFAWQVVPLSVATVNKYDLFKTSNFKQADTLAPVVKKGDLPSLRALASSLATQVNPGLLSDVDTYTYRSPDVMLSTAQDWRPGQRTEQAHIWQATFDPSALVFTQSPRDPVPTAADPNAREGYWTGDGGSPRSAQHGTVNISIYSPLYASGGGVGSGAYAFDYLPETHAYFPTERFDQVVQQGHWTFGRKGSGYIALYSYKPTHWGTEDPKTDFTNGLTKKFDLIADGGADNVWIAEVGRAADQHGAADPFKAFIDRIAAAPVVVTPVAKRCPATASCHPAYAVSYDSPSQGALTFGWDPDAGSEQAPLKVQGKDVALHQTDFRWSSPYATSRWNSGKYTATAGGASLSLTFPVR